MLIKDDFSVMLKTKKKLGSYIGTVSSETIDWKTWYK